MTQSASLSPAQAHHMLQHGQAVLIDVRNADEFANQHIAWALSVPLDQLDTTLSALTLPQNTQIITQCQRGQRGAQACAQIDKQAIINPVANLDGGIDAWIAAGLPVIGASSAPNSLPLARQVQMIVGVLIVLSVLIGFTGHSIGFVLAGLFGGALAFAGITGWCGLAIILMRAPWN